MPDVSLSLGPVGFAAFELPQTICWGGRQRLIVHTMPDGTRIIDALGRDDSNIDWAGSFSGPTAVDRARQIDLLRASGGMLELLWDGFFYTVVIEEFKADYTNPSWIPYRLSCKVLRDEAAGHEQAFASVLESVVDDVAAATGLATLPAATALTDAVAAEGAATRDTASFSTASNLLGSQISAAQSTLAATSTSVSALTINSAAELVAAAGLASQLANTARAIGYLQRAQANLRNAST